MVPPIAVRQCRPLSLSTIVLAAALVMPAAVGAQNDEASGVAGDDDVAAAGVVVKQIQGDSRQKRAAGPKARCQSFENRVTYKRAGAPGKGVVKRDFGGGNGDRGELIFSDAATGIGLFWMNDPGYVSIHIAAPAGGPDADDLAGLLFEAAPGSMPRRALLDGLTELAATADVTQEQLFTAFDERARASDGGCLWTTRFTPRKADRGGLVPFWEAMVGVPLAEPGASGEGRFKVEVTWQGADGAEQVSAQSFDAISSADEAPGYFFDVGDENLLVKLLDACADNNHFWVFAGSTTVVDFDVTVTDTVSGQTKTYPSPLATEPAVTDTMAFETCP